MHAEKAIEEMVRQTKSPVFKNGLMKSGTIVRHMILPGYTKDSKDIICYLYEKYKDDIYISIMNQYTPPQDMEAMGFAKLSRSVTKESMTK